MRRIRYAVAVSVDGYIAGPDGRATWIITDREVGYILEEFDTLLVGRRTFELMPRGGSIFGERLSNSGLVDTVELTVMPVLLGGGVPFLPPPASRKDLKLSAHKVFPKTGIVSMAYTVRS